MRLLASQPMTLPVFLAELELVVLLREEKIPEIHLDDGLPTPDRHLLLGLVQSACVAVEEHDSESVVFVERCAFRLSGSGERRELASGLVIAKSVDGGFGVVAAGDYRVARSVARQAVRWFTGRLRLDVP
ncbi:MAG: hypothetical protein FJY85_02325 [Deltaproteobacteria bacterium]|nr:hypothetical protein [Deltaproteobacteria bacterium]